MLMLGYLGNAASMEGGGGSRWITQINSNTIMEGITLSIFRARKKEPPMHHIHTIARLSEAPDLL